MYSDAALSVVDHSCEPSAAVEFRGTRLTLRAGADTPSLASLSFSYVDPGSEWGYRQQYLAKYFYFTCTCHKCKHKL